MVIWIVALWQSWITTHLQKREIAGQGLVEYALILLFVAIVVMVVSAVGNTICTNWYAKLINNTVFANGSSVSCSTGQ